MCKFVFLPNFTQTLCNQLWTAVTREHAFMIECANPCHTLRGLEVAHVPDMLTHYIRLLAQQFNSNPFEGTTSIQRNSLIRAGGPMFNLQHGALKIWAAQGEIPGLIANDLVIDSLTFSGLQLDGAFSPG